MAVEEGVVATVAADPLFTVFGGVGFAGAETTGPSLLPTEGGVTVADVGAVVAVFAALPFFTTFLRLPPTLPPEGDCFGVVVVAVAVTVAAAFGAGVLSFSVDTEADVVGGAGGVAVAAAALAVGTSFSSFEEDVGDDDETGVSTTGASATAVGAASGSDAAAGATAAGTAEAASAAGGAAAEAPPSSLPLAASLVESTALEEDGAADSAVVFSVSAGEGGGGEDASAGDPLRSVAAAPVSEDAAAAALAAVAAAAAADGTEPFFNRAPRSSSLSAFHRRPISAIRSFNGSVCTDGICSFTNTAYGLATPLFFRFAFLDPRFVFAASSALRPFPLPLASCADALFAFPFWVAAVFLIFALALRVRRGFRRFGRLTAFGRVACSALAKGPNSRA